MTHQECKAERFRALHVPGKPFVLFNAWDAGSAKVITTSGVAAIGTSSWSVADANGFTDGEHIPLTLAIENLRRIVGVTELPVTFDLESGYGDEPELVGESVRFAIEAGAVGCNLEDSVPADRKLRPAADQAARIRRARQMADAANTGFFINARTDVFLQRPAKQHDEAMAAEAIDRAHAYAEAGADGLFAPGLVDISLIAQLVGESPLPVNIMVEDGTPPLPALAERGVARVSYGPGPYLTAMKALQEAAKAANGSRSTAGIQLGARD